MLALYDTVKFKTMLFFIQKILRFNLGVAFLKSVSILAWEKDHCTEIKRHCGGVGWGGVGEGLRKATFWRGGGNMV